MIFGPQFDTRLVVGQTFRVEYRPHSTITIRKMELSSQDYGPEDEGAVDCWRIEGFIEPENELVGINFRAWDDVDRKYLYVTQIPELDSHYVLLFHDYVEPPP